MSEERDLETRPRRARVGSLDQHYLALVRKIVASDEFRASKSRVVGVTSSLDGEGSSTVATNIALTAAGLNAGPVLLIDANDENPSLHKIFGVSGDAGFQNALSGKRSPLECVTPSSVEGLSLVLNGKPSSGEVPIYSKSSIDELLIEWEDTFDWIVFDLPPANDVSAATLLASRLNNVMLVVEADRVDSDIAQRTCTRLRRANVNLIGAVYNKAPNMRRMGLHDVEPA